MYKIFIPFFWVLHFNGLAQSHNSMKDTLVYQCKYKYSWIRDTAQRSMKVQDQMCLDIYSENHTVYFSIPKQKGLKQLEEDIKNKISLEEAAKNVSNYNTNAEAEVLLTDYKANSYKMLDRLSSRAYNYTSPIESIKWEIQMDTLTVLNFLCQKAIGKYSGRTYTAWFTESISFSYGPYKFSGLPGLILKIYDSKEEFMLVCTEILTKSSLNEMPYYDAYQNSKNIGRNDLFKIKKLFFENYPAYLMAEKGVVFTPNNPNEVKKNDTRNYNTIELK